MGKAIKLLPKRYDFPDDETLPLRKSQYEVLFWNGWIFFYSSSYREKLLFLFSFSSPQWIICLHLTPSYLHVVLHYVHKPSLWSSSLPPDWQLNLEHLLSSISTVPPLHVSKPSQPRLLGFISINALTPTVPHTLNSNPLHPAYSQRKSEHPGLCYLFLHLLSFRQCHYPQTIHHKHRGHQLADPREASVRTATVLH